MTKTETAELSFEEKIKKLETIVSELESGGVALEEAINKYSEAMKLSKECTEKLTEDGTLENFEVKE